MKLQGNSCKTIEELFAVYINNHHSRYKNLHFLQLKIDDKSKITIIFNCAVFIRMSTNES